MARDKPRAVGTLAKNQEIRPTNCRQKIQQEKDQFSQHTEKKVKYTRGIVGKRQQLEQKSTTVQPYYHH